MSEDLLYLSVNENWKIISTEILGALQSESKSKSIEEFLHELRDSKPELFTLISKYFDQLYRFKNLVKTTIKDGRTNEVQEQKLALRKTMSDINDLIALELKNSNLNS